MSLRHIGIDLEISRFWVRLRHLLKVSEIIFWKIYFHHKVLYVLCFLDILIQYMLPLFSLSIYFVFILETLSRPRRHQLSTVLILNSLLKCWRRPQLRNFSNHRHQHSWLYTQLRRFFLFSTLLSIYSTPFFSKIQAVSCVLSTQNEMYTSERERERDRERERESFQNPYILQFVLRFGKWTSLKI